MPIQSLITTLISLGGLLVAIATTYVTVRTFYDKRRNEDRQRQREELDRLQTARQAELDNYAIGKKKEYAAERDFAHLMKQYEQLAANISTLMNFQREELADLESDLKEVKGMLQALLTQLGSSETAIMRMLKKSE